MKWGFLSMGMFFSWVYFPWFFSRFFPWDFFRGEFFPWVFFVGFFSVGKFIRGVFFPQLKSTKGDKNKSVINSVTEKFCRIDFAYHSVQTCPPFSELEHRIFLKFLEIQKCQSKLNTMRKPGQILRPRHLPRSTAGMF